MTVVHQGRRLAPTVVARVALCSVLLLSSAAAVTGQSAKDQAEAAANYDRGMIFFQQGAYKEAEEAFRQAEKKNDKNLEYQFAIGYTYLKLHKPDDALKRYSKIYKNDPTNLRAIVGMAATYEEMLNYREAVRMWQRYVKMNLPPEEKREADEMLRTAQARFVSDYEIAENPSGGAPNAATPEQEQALGLQAARQLASSGMPLLRDDEVHSYLLFLCGALVSNAKQFPTKYELFVLDSPVVNAQTTPGFIFVYRGILDTVDTEAELAGVLAHEISHTVAHHSGKAVTKAAQDQATQEALQRSDNKLAKFLGGLMALGNPMGAASFSREQETQADRLGIHIAFDSGFDPHGLSSLFRKFEALQPSSRKSWDLMTKTHPFSVDRMNMVNDYVELLPARDFRGSSAEFKRMKARLATLPPPPDTPAPAPAAAAPPPGASLPGAAGSAVIPFTLDNAPFAGEIPATWGARKTDSGTIIFEGQKGTEAYEATIELEIAPKANVPNASLDDIAEIVYRANAAKQNAAVGRPEARTDGTRRALAVSGTYSLQGNQGAVPVRHISVVMDYPGYFVILSYFAPEVLYAKYQPVFGQIGESFRYTGR